LYGLCISNKTDNQKKREFNKETHILFVDYEKSFDKVLKNKLWNIMITKGYPLHLTDTIVKLYNSTLTSTDNGTLSPRFESTNQGVS
jgi:hypothetical protein